MASDDADFQRFLEQLRTFVPPGAFDAHAHLYRGPDASEAVPRHLEDDRGHVGWDAWHQSLMRWMGNRAPAAGLFFAYPGPGLERRVANQFVTDQLQPHPDSRALMLVHPQDDPSTVEAEVASNRFAGFKVYHCYADRPDSFAAEPHEFLPDWVWEIADRLELAITLHLVRSRALADVANQDYIRDRCRRFPQARLVLAHAARGFCDAHTAEGITSLRGLDNVFFDTSAICEASAFEAVLRQFGPTRLLFGTDFPVSEMVGRCVRVGDGFLWLDEKNVAWEEADFAEPTLVGVESLLALQQACRTMRLTDGDVEQIFCDGARRMLGIGDSAAIKTDETYRRARQIMPGGTQLLSKRPEMYAPGRWPAYFSEARGCEIIDLDGRRFCDMTTSGIGSCLLGFADPDVTDAVVRRVQLGSMCTLNAAEEVELAELLVALHPWADQVRYGRTGGESMAIAVRIARAHTGRDRVAFCGYHGWADWYLAANLPDQSASGAGEGRGSVRENRLDRLDGHLLPGLAPAGVPRPLGGTALPFAYNRLDELREIAKQHGSQLAAVVLEPFRTTEPAPEFLEGVRDVCDHCGAVLVFDEITSAWRFTRGGVHLRYGIEPDLAVFAKAIGNGHPLGAILGRRTVMEAAQTTFISSTYWTESVGPTAALATIRKMQRVDVPAHVERIGLLFRDGLQEIARRHQVPLRITGHGALLFITFAHPESAAIGTLQTIRLLDHGFLSGSGFYPSLAHTDRHLEAFLSAADKVFEELADAIRQGDVQQRLDGPVRHSGFARLT